MQEEEIQISTDDGTWDPNKYQEKNSTFQTMEPFKRKLINSKKGSHSEFVIPTCNRFLFLDDDDSEDDLSMKRDKADTEIGNSQCKRHHVKIHIERRINNLERKRIC